MPSDKFWPDRGFEPGSMPTPIHRRDAINNSLAKTNLAFTLPNEPIHAVQTTRLHLKRKADANLFSTYRVSMAVSAPNSPSTSKKSYKFNLTFAMKDAGPQKVESPVFRFLDLPGELRNKIYLLVIDSGRQQALIVHRPRIAALRARTRIDRTVPLPNGDPDAPPETGRDAVIKRSTHRPGMALTQVCRQIRSEFFPLYTQRQEIGIDICDITGFVKTFYHPGTLTTAQQHEQEKPFKANLTIAISDTVQPAERDGLDVLHLLQVWALSLNMQAGFGRYAKPGHQSSDHLARDLYRLLGRTIKADGTPTSMNRRWRVILRHSHLHALVIHRDPPRRPIPGSQLTYAVRPYIHIVFKPCTAAWWMTHYESKIHDGWLAAHGFDNTQYFDIKVGKLTHQHFVHPRH